MDRGQALTRFFQRDSTQAIVFQFVPQNPHVWRCFDTNPHLIATDSHHGNHHRISNPNPFVLFAGKDEHENLQGNKCVGMNTEN